MQMHAENPRRHPSKSGETQLFGTSLCHYLELLATIDCGEAFGRLRVGHDFGFCSLPKPRREHRGGVASWRRQMLLDLFREAEPTSRLRTRCGLSVAQATGSKHHFQRGGCFETMPANE